MHPLLLLSFAFLGGLVLNIMPCVLPVLTLKAFTLMRSQEQSRREQRVHGVGYALGTMSALLALGVVVLLVRSAGKSLGWGMQFQYPPFVAVLTLVLFVFGLNALGVFEFSVSGSGKERHGWLGSVANGWFAAVMATPCSAPFLGPAAALAVEASTPAWLSLLVFVAIGFGLAFPFVLLSFVPAVGKLLPRPGAWMDTFKQLMGFTLMGAAVWLYGVLQRQLPPESATLFLAFLLVVGFCVWCVGRFGGLDASALRRWGLRGAIVAVVVAGFSWVPLAPRAKAAALPGAPGGEPLAHAAVKDGKINWAAFDPRHIERSLAAGRPVFLDFTADWCTSCQANDKLFVDTPAVHQALEATGVLPMKVDMTEEDEVMEAWLRKTGRSAIPVYVVVRPGGEMDLLPVAITTQMVVELLERSAVRGPLTQR